MENKDKYKGYDKNTLILELKRFYKDFGRIPSRKDFESKSDYPSRKTFNKYFGTFNNALREAGFNVKDNKVDYTKDYLISEIHRFVEEYGRKPKRRDMNNKNSYPLNYYFEKMFGSWNNAIKESGLRVSVSQYSESELDVAFNSFVKEYGRPPKLHEFNDSSRYPSFWCYQNRFGSWNKALIHYGFEPNEGTSGKWFQLENGEICKSTYEYDVSNWLRENGISYLRNVPYREFIDEYDGRKDCDYVIIQNGEWIWLEIAGLYSNRTKKSKMEKVYIENFEQKIDNLLSKFNYQIFYPEDFIEYSLEELFDFLWEIPESPWDDGNETIYQGVGEKPEKVIEWLKSEEKCTTEFLMR